MLHDVTQHLACCIPTIKQSCVQAHTHAHTHTRTHACTHVQVEESEYELEELGLGGGKKNRKPPPRVAELEEIVGRCGAITLISVRL